MNDYRKILIVDDTPENLQVLGGMLEQSEYEVLVATNGPKALEAVRRSKPDLILLDILMPGMDGFEVCKMLKADPKLSTIPVIYISALGLHEQKMHAFQQGAEDYITKPFQVEEVLARVNTHVQLKMHRDHLQLLVEQKTRELVLAKEATIASMAILAEYRDPETGGHIQRCKSYVKLLMQDLVRSNPEILANDDMELLYQSVPLHDIGKVGVPDAILNKPGPLTAQEYMEMQKHALLGRDVIRRTEQILGASSFLRYARELAECHHEKWDGSGYPHGLIGDQIPLSARLMALADVYDALISVRPYKKAFSYSDAYTILTQGDGRTRPEHFDPLILAAFSRQKEEMERIAKAFTE